MAALASLTITRACSREICGSSSTRSQVDFRPMVIEPALRSSVRNPIFSRSKRLLRVGPFLDEPEPDESTVLKANTIADGGRVTRIFSTRMRARHRLSSPVLQAFSETHARWRSHGHDGAECRIVS